ncbi:MAG: 8-amino-7-oxononanoate synthase [Bacteroidetes bacterium]|nr:8-amino-7-oxononanoate synthase [Bacteroidota bacterium]
METLNRYREILETLKANDNYRSFPESDSGNLLNLCSNDYLGLNSNKEFHDNFLAEFKRKTYKFSSCSSRLLSGNSIEHTKLEKLLADSYQSEACLLYNSGYHANVGIISALASKKDLIIADKLVHASIIDGAKLSNATVIRFKHLDYLHLENILKKNRKNYENVFIISESIFSMDGDIADLERLIELKQKYNCLLYIDEAHAFGVRGNNGLGCVEESQVINEIDFIVGTFGKAIASIGAFVICSNLFRQYLINHSRSLIFTTALPPINIAWTIYILKKLPELNQEREKLKSLSMQFAKMLNRETQSHIIPFIIGTNKNAIDKSIELKQNGFTILPIRYPTVPKGTARLRFSLNANMDIKQLIPIKNILKKQ